MEEDTDEVADALADEPVPFAPTAAVANAAPSRKTRSGLFHLPNYAAWFTADTATAIGVALRTLALSLIGYSVSGSTVAAGWIGSAAAIAQQLSAVFGGTFVDRHDRRILIMINAFVGLGCWGSVTALLLTHTLSFPLLLSIAVISSAVNGFLGPASDAMLRSIVNANEYPRARSVNEGRDATVNMAGSPVGSFLFSIRPWLPFLIVSIMYALAGVAASRIHSKNITVTSTTSSVHTFFHDFTQGWRWSLHRRMLLVVMVASAVLNFGVNGYQYGIQLHLMATHTPTVAIGFLDTGVFAAMLVGSCIGGKISDHIAVGPVVCAGFVVVCVATIPLICTDNYWVVLVSTSLMCVPFPIINALMMGFIFAKTPHDMQGRVAVTLTVPAQVLSMFCGATAGSLLPTVGYHMTMVVFFTAVALSMVVVLCSRPLRSIPASSQWESAILE